MRLFGDEGPSLRKLFEHPPPDPDLKTYRSKAEWVRVRQTRALIAIAAASWLTNTLVALKVFDVL